VTVHEDAHTGPENAPDSDPPTDDPNGPQEPNKPSGTTPWSVEPYPVEWRVDCVEWEPILGLPERFNTLKRQEWAALMRVSQLTVSPAMIAENHAELTDLAEQIRILGFKADRVLSQHFVSRGIQ
jgi:hypothetical protein